MYAAIVAGGLGTRASAMTGNRFPKALLPVAGVPIIVRQMRVLQREGVTKVFVLAGHLGDQLQRALAPEAEALGLELSAIVERVPLGTAGCLGILTPSPEDILIVYGDMLFDIALSPLFEFHRRQRAILTIVAHPNDHPETSDVVIEDNGLVKAIIPAGKARLADSRNLVPAGLYVASPAFLASIERNRKADLIRDVFPALVSTGAKLAVYNTPEYLRDVGSPARHKVAERDVAAGRPERMNLHHSRPAIFFDCDGVLNEELGPQGAVVPDDVKVISGAGDAVRRAREAGLLTIAITNRPQVAKGFVTFDGLSHILGRLESLLAHDGGVLDRIYFCPHHPQAGFPGENAALKVRCECRKPGTLLLRQAFADLPIDKMRSALIGDSLRDIGAARGAHIWAYGVRTGHGCRDRESYVRESGTPPVPDLMFSDVSEAVDFQISYKELAASVAPAIKDRGNATGVPVLVGVCGRSRAGKSCVAHAIVRDLTEHGQRCLHVRLDHWIVPATERILNGSAESRNRVEVLPALVRALRIGTVVCSPGYDASTRSADVPVTYDPTGHSVIVLDGVFAGHHSIQELLDVVVFVEATSDLERNRFESFYRWKGFDANAIDALRQQRASDEWPAAGRQREAADFVIKSEKNAL